MEINEKERKEKEDKLIVEITRVLKEKGIEIVENIYIPVLDEKYSKHGYYPDIGIEGVIRVKKELNKEKDYLNKLRAEIGLDRGQASPL